MSPKSSARRRGFRTPVSGLYPEGMTAQPDPGGRDLGELGRRVLGAADDAAVAATGWWRSAGLAQRARALPDTVTTRVETLLDRVVARAVADPLDVHTVDDVRERLGEAPTGSGSAAAWVTALAGRTKRTVSLRGRAIPLTVATKLGTEAVTSFRLGAYELEVLASLLVHRLREAGLPADARAVQRVTVNAYVWPRRGADVVRRRQVAPANLAALWVGRVLAVEPAVGRVTKAAETLLGLDRAALDRIALRS
jgi:hypothetical protein